MKINVLQIQPKGPMLMDLEWYAIAQLNPMLTFDKRFRKLHQIKRGVNYAPFYLGRRKLLNILIRYPYEKGILQTVAFSNLPRTST